MDIEVREPFYEGKAKVLLHTSDPGLVVQQFKDDATAFNRQKIGQIGGKGPINLRISVALFRLLEAHGVPTHFVAVLDDRRMLVRRVQIVPLEVVVRNRVAGTFARRYGLAEGTVLPRPVVELFYKDDALGDPLVVPEAAAVLGWANESELHELHRRALQVNDVLRAFFFERGVELVDFKLEFGRTEDGSILLADEISPDSCRFWDVASGRKLDKDRFRQDLGGIEEAYAEMLRRVEGNRES